MRYTRWYNVNVVSWMENRQSTIFLFSRLTFYEFFFVISVLPPTTSISKAAKLEDICRNDGESSMSSLSTNSSQSSRRLIRADFSLFKVSFYPEKKFSNLFLFSILKSKMENFEISQSAKHSKWNLHNWSEEIAKLTVEST